MGPGNEKLVFNFVINFRRMTYFLLCPLETQGRYEYIFTIFLAFNLGIYSRNNIM